MAVRTLKLSVLILAVLAVVPAHAQVNYDDPNMAHTGGFVTEATNACVRNAGDPRQFERCMIEYASTSQPDPDQTVAGPTDLNSRDLASEAQQGSR